MDQTWKSETIKGIVMSRRVEKIIVVRLNKTMIEAMSLRNIFMIAFGFDELTETVKTVGIPGKLKIIPRSFMDVRTLGDGFRIITTLSNCIRTERPDIVHVNALQDLIFVFTAIHIFFPRDLRPAIIAMSRNPLTWKNSKKAWLAAKWVQYFADGFVALSTLHKNQLLDLGIPEEKLSVIPNPYDVDQVKPVDRFQGKIGRSPRIVYIANICERKAQDVLIQAASFVLKKFPDVDGRKGCTGRRGLRRKDILADPCTRSF